MSRSPTFKLRLTIAAQVKPVVCLSQQRNVNQCFKECCGSTRMLILNPMEMSPLILDSSYEAIGTGTLYARSEGLR